MNVHALEDTLSVIKVAAVGLLKARAAGQPLVQAVQSPEFLAALAQAAPELPEAASEATSLSLVDDLELARFLFGMVTDVVRAVRAAPVATEGRAA